jgi:hypothetical protein
MMAPLGSGLAAVFLLTGSPVSGQAQTAPYRAPRTGDGKPSLNGIWQANTSVNYDLEPHAAKPSPVVALGATGAVPAGLGVVEGDQIPYKPKRSPRKRRTAKNG